MVSFVPVLLGCAMFGMGLMLKGSDFLPLLKRPTDVVIGLLAQFCFMPLIAVLLVHVLELPKELAVGVILVGCCPGGTSSNIVSYLAKGDVALSVAMTSCSTLLAPVLTPLLVSMTVAVSIEVNALAMSLSVLKVVLLPVALGALANTYLPRLVGRIKWIMPYVSSVAVLLVAAIVTIANWQSIRLGWGIVVVAVILHNLLGMLSGYVVAMILKRDGTKCRTLAIEVGMQNSGLAASLAALHFAYFPMAAVPGALFSVWHNFSGAVFALCVRLARPSTKD